MALGGNIYMILNILTPRGDGRGATEVTRGGLHPRLASASVGASVVKCPVFNGTSITSALFKLLPLAGS
jgi:hypothetical protein